MNYKIFKFTLMFQGLYYAITGLWAIVNLESFSRLTNHYGDPFEMYSIAGMALVVGLFLIWSAQKEVARKPAGFLALGFVLAVIIPEAIFLPQIGNPPLFWIDFVIEAIIGFLLLISLFAKKVP